MEVNRNKYSNNNLAFGSRKIMPVFVRDMQDRPVKAWFSELSLSAPEDIEAMKRVNNEWNGCGLYYNRSLYDEFHNGLQIYAIEKKSKKELFDNLLCLSSIKTEKNNNGNDFKVIHLQASPDSNYYAGENRKYKTAGTTNIFGLVNLAHSDDKINIFKLNSGADKFYDSFNMRTDQKGYRVFDRLEMIAFIKEQIAKTKAILRAEAQRWK